MKREDADETRKKVEAEGRRVTVISGNLGDPGFCRDAVRKVHDHFGRIGIALDRSWFVSDILDDIEVGQRAGCRTILINNRHETEWLRTPRRWPDYMATNLEEAARIIDARDSLSTLTPAGAKAEEPI